MILFPPAKINLGLNVTDKRTDGYHNLETIMFQIPFQDILELVPSDKFTFTQSGLTIAGKSDDNLCVRAYQLIQHRWKIDPVNIHLHKLIPMGAGMGGGSADATYVLKGLNSLFSLGIDSQTLQSLALELGSDCPLFVEEKPQFAQGRGEILSPIHVDLTGKQLLVINLGIHVSTQLAFSKIQPKKPSLSIPEIVQKPIEMWKESLVNDFETGVFSAYPILEEVKKKMYQEGAVYASMTGSGSTIFGIFDEVVSFDFFPQAQIQKWISL